jgi:hypothetical protein
MESNDFGLSRRYFQRSTAPRRLGYSYNLSEGIKGTRLEYYHAVVGSLPNVQPYSI